MQPKKNSKLLYSESLIVRFMGFSSVLIILILGLASISTFSILGFCVGLPIVFGCYLIWRAIYRVEVLEDRFVLLKRSKNVPIPFEIITEIYKNREGFAPIYVYVVRYLNQNGKLKYFTFDATDDKIEEIIETIHKVRPDLHVYIRE